MQRTNWLATASGLLFVAMAVHSAGCSHFSADCTALITCTSGGGGDADAGGADAGMGDGGVNCDPAHDGVGMVSTVDVSCGLFVSSGMGQDSDDPKVADGTHNLPY